MPSELSHEDLLRSIVASPNRAEREMLIEEARRRLDDASPPATNANPWNAGNGGC
ncbi:MAG TPA: hypothetical protein VFH78_16080 [Candidatus Thermoplasmatota archaeon]|nr:hypothetical protein [Candidatus Thermoplasmatota archaeon]